jgi:ribosomal protein S27E
MLPLPAGREASQGGGAARYERHWPERTLLYQLVQEYYFALKAHLAAQGTALPGYVEQEFEDYLSRGRLEHGFLRVRCDSCHAEHLVAFSWPLHALSGQGRGSVNARRTAGRDDLHPKGIKAQRLKRVFHIDIETCRDCGGAVRIIACIEDPEVIAKILTHLDEKDHSQGTGLLPQGRAPPAGLFG